MSRLICCALSLFVTVAALPLTSFARTVGEHPLPSGIVGHLYGAGTAPDREAASVSVERLAASRHYLYVGLRDAEGIEYVDVWDVRNPADARLVDTLNFGDVQQNGVQFIPLALIPFNGGVLIQTYGGLEVYRQADNGTLELVERFNLTTGLQPPQMSQISVAGKYGSHRQQVIPNEEITRENQDRVHQQVLLDFTRPFDPFMYWGGSDGPSIALDKPVNVTFDGEPASLTYDAFGGTATLIRMEHRLRSHLDEFWMSKIERTFDSESLDLSLEALMAEVIGSADLRSLQNEAIRIYGESLEVSLDETVRGVLLRNHDPDERLTDVLEEHGIGLDEPLEHALKKIFMEELSAEAEARIATELYSPLLKAWLQQLFDLSEEVESLNDVINHVGGLFNAEIDEAGGIVRYLTLKVVAPLLGNPEHMTLTLQDLVDRAVASDVAPIVDETLRTAGGFGAIDTLLNSLEAALSTAEVIDELPGLGFDVVPDFPECAGFPESTRELLDLALYSWGDSSTGGLDPEGLAWFELLKFYQYLSSHETEFAGFIADIEAEIRAMQRRLGGSVVRELSGAFKLTTDVNQSLDAIYEAFSESLAARQIVGRMLAMQLVEAIGADSLQASMTIREALEAWGIAIESRGANAADLDTLIGALEARELSDLRLEAFITSFEQEPAFDLRPHLRSFLKTELQQRFGVSNADASLRSALRVYLARHINLDDTLGEGLGEVLNDTLFGARAMGGNLRASLPFFSGRGDCIAAWMKALEAISIVTAVVDEGITAEAIKVALDTAYRTGTRYLVNVMMGELIFQVVDLYSGDQGRWLASNVDIMTQRFELFQGDPGETESIRGAFAWQDRIGFIVETRFEDDPFGARRMELVMFHPDNREETILREDLGRWQQLDFVHHAEGALYLGGTYFLDKDDDLPFGHAMVLDLASRPIDAQLIHGEGLGVLAGGQHMASVNHGAHLALAREGEVRFVPNPAGHSLPSENSAQSPVILSVPAAKSVPPGERAAFNVDASGTAPLEYQWFKDGVALGEATGDKVVIKAASPTDAGDYHVVVSNAAGSVESSPAELSIGGTSKVSISEEPSDHVGYQDQSITFAVEAQGESPLAYHWYHDGEVIAGATGPTLMLDGIDFDDAGRYQAVVESGGLRARSRSAQLIVVDAPEPSLLRKPQDLEVRTGKRATLKAQAVGLAPVTFQWYREGAAIADATSSSLIIDSVNDANAGHYRMSARDATGGSREANFEVIHLNGVRLVPELRNDGRLRLIITHKKPGEAYTIQVSNDLMTWETLGEVENDGEASIFIDPDRSEFTHRYYRVLIESN